MARLWHNQTHRCERKGNEKGKPSVRWSSESRVTTKLQRLLVKLYNFFPFAVAESLLLSAFFGDATSPLMHQTQTVNRGLPGEKKESITSCKENSAFHSHPLRCWGGPLACSSWKESPKGLAGSLGPRSAKSWPCGGTTSPPLPGCCTRRGCVLRPHQIPRFPLFLALLYSVLSFPFPLPPGTANPWKRRNLFPAEADRKSVV